MKNPSVEYIERFAATIETVDTGLGMALVSGAHAIEDIRRHLQADLLEMNFWVKQLRSLPKSQKHFQEVAAMLGRWLEEIGNDGS